MAMQSLLVTRTVHFLDLLGNGRLYRVPAYQRDYSWKEEQWEDLWNDILEMRDNSQARHYMGAMVIEEKSDREFLIIDGQQRMATLSILALAVLARLGELKSTGIDQEANQERALELRKRFIGEKDPASLVESSKLRLNESDDGFYQDYLVQLRQPHHPKGLSRSNRLLWDCFNYFRRKLSETPALETSGEALATLLSETVARQLLFILITVDDELNAYMVFETLNARGLELSSTDLLKNYLFSRVKVRSELESVQRRWKALISTVRQERFPEFLRYHLLCEQPKIRTDRLFKLVRDKVKSPDDVFALLEALEKRAELYAAILDPTHEFWSEHLAARQYLRLLRLFRAKQMTPLLFAAWEAFSMEDFERTLKLVVIITFRYSIVSDLNTNELEPVYHRAAKAVLEGTAGGPSAVYKVLQGIYVDDTRFQQDFSRLEFTRAQRKVAKYVLCRLEDDRSNQHHDPETNPGSIEHILPENPLDGWEEAIPRERWDKVAYRLGNLTLLEPGLNRQCANASYEAKMEQYSKSGYHITNSIPDMAPEQWTLSHLELRQREMAKRAAALWRADFA